MSRLNSLRSLISMSPGSTKARVTDSVMCGILLAYRRMSVGRRIVGRGHLVYRARGPGITCWA